MGGGKESIVSIGGDYSICDQAVGRPEQSSRIRGTTGTSMTSANTTATGWPRVVLAIKKARARGTTTRPTTPHFCQYQTTTNRSTLARNNRPSVGKSQLGAASIALANWSRYWFVGAASPVIASGLATSTQQSTAKSKLTIIPVTSPAATKKDRSRSRGGA